MTVWSSCVQVAYKWVQGAFKESDQCMQWMHSFWYTGESWDRTEKHAKKWSIFFRNLRKLFQNRSHVLRITISSSALFLNSSSEILECWLGLPWYWKMWIVGMGHRHWNDLTNVTRRFATKLWHFVGVLNACASIVACEERMCVCEQINSKWLWLWWLCGE